MVQMVQQQSILGENKSSTNSPASLSLFEPMVPANSFDPEALTWISDQVQKEVKRFRDLKTRVIPLQVSSFSIQLENKQGSSFKKTVNRIDTDSKFPFDKIQRIMISSPVPYPAKSDYEFVHVLLFTDKQVPLMLPYLYSKSVANNDLTDWMFVNGSGVTVRHRVPTFMHSS